MFYANVFTKKPFLAHNLIVLRSKMILKKLLNAFFCSVEKCYIFPCVYFDSKKRKYLLRKTVPDSSIMYKNV